MAPVRRQPAIHPRLDVLLRCRSRAAWGIDARRSPGLPEEHAPRFDVAVERSPAQVLPRRRPPVTVGDDPRVRPFVRQTRPRRPRRVAAMRLPVQELHREPRRRISRQHRGLDSPLRDDSRDVRVPMSMPAFASRNRWTMGGSEPSARCRNFTATRSLLSPSTAALPDSPMPPVPIISSSGYCFADDVSRLRPAAAHAIHDSGPRRLFPRWLSARRFMRSPSRTSGASSRREHVARAVTALTSS